MTGVEHPVLLVDGHGESVQAAFVVVQGLPHSQCRLTLKYSGGEITGEAFDYFEAICQIRNELDAIGYRPMCYGASRNVYPSGMGRDMGRGLKAYRLRLGQQPAMSDLVNIFDVGPDVEPASVKDQREFWKSWWKSTVWATIRRHSPSAMARCRTAPSENTSTPAWSSGTARQLAR